MSLALFLRAVETGAFENYVNADFAPRKILSVLFSINLKSLAVNSDCTGFIISRYCVETFADLSAVTALCGIIL